MRKIYTTILLFGMSAPPLLAQVLFPESYVVIFDTTRHFKGSIAPSIEVKTPKELYLEINNQADLAFRFKKNALIVANRFELTKNGSETILSGGFIYAKFKKFFDNPFVIEYYNQYQWAEARGMIKKYAVGANLRYKIYKNQSSGAFAGIGTFYEFEEWNYLAVPVERLPENEEIIRVNYLKYNFYVSTQQALSDKVKIEAAFYLQNQFTDLLNNPRIGGSSGLSFALSPKVSIGLQYRMLYDYAPVVPVDKLWFNAYSQLEVNF